MKYRIEELAAGLALFFWKKEDTEIRVSQVFKKILWKEGDGKRASGF